MKDLWRPFALLMQTLTEKELVGVGAFTIRTKERLCCLRPIGGLLIIDTLLYPDEIKVDLKTKLPQAKLSVSEKKMANNLVEMMTQLSVQRILKIIIAKLWKNLLTPS